MKKLLALILATFMLISLVGCNFENPADNTDSTPKKEITFSGLVAVDNSDCVIKVTEIDPDSMWGYAIKVELENKSADKTYMFSVDGAAINGIQCDPFFATE